MPITCQDCHKQMSPSAVVCPHCGIRQARGQQQVAEEPPLGKPGGPVHVSAEEARALLHVAGAGQTEARARGLMALVLPRERASGRGRAAEWALAVIGAPMLLAGIAVSAPMLLSISLVGRWHLWQRVTLDGHEIALTFFLGLFGASGISWATSAAGWSFESTLSLVAVCFGAMLARLWVRRLD